MMELIGLLDPQWQQVEIIQLDLGTGTAALCAGGNGGTPGDEGIGTVEEFNGWIQQLQADASNITTS